LWRRYQQVGSKGLQHGNAGRASNRSKPAKFRRRVLSLIKQKYSGSAEERFGPTLAAEHLAEEDGIVIDHETLRCWMLAEGLWSRQRKRKKHCPRRERKAHFGELVQLDGSFHDWLEERGPRGCLMDMVDDATSRTQAGLGKEETIWAAAGVLRPGVHPDRLIKKLRRKGIDSYEAANQYLEKEYLPEHNRRFARSAAKPEDYHGRKLTARELRQILRLETERTISNDWVIRHNGRYLQLQPGQRRYGPTQNKALVCEWEDGAMEVYYRGERMAFTELQEPMPKASRPLAPAARVIVVRKAKKNHPWHQGYQNMKPLVPNRAIAGPLVGIRTYASP
jgi:hypothetical protein